MTVYAIGDIQGCYDDLQRLLDKIGFDPGQDRLWLVGDLVNRGPQSLATLRWLKKLGPAAITVLGNHDLHLLAAAFGVRKLRRSDSLAPILAAPDGDSLIDWLRQQPLLHVEPPFCLAHAGIYPGWTLTQAQQLAQEVRDVLAGDAAVFLKVMYGDEPALWSEHLTGTERLRFIVNAFTRMRYVDADGGLDFAHNGPPGSQPDSLMPWFALPGRKHLDATVIFGHWSSLGYYQGYQCYGIDTGGLWGGALTALALDTLTVHQVHCQGQRTP
ncbi:MAG: symmetrical bis(5'-nucleosyl)-tetraphosphatase [Methylococcales bacterium]|nr:symmetrical bis(5'-nucleosyl)-tetraphosphatase [Methylococcales bacterium]